MKSNKVILNGETLIDLTQVTAVPSDVTQGKIFLLANGEIGVGTAQAGGKFGELVDRSITEVTAQDLAGITEIGESAFEYCNALESVTIPGNIITIRQNAFNYTTPETITVQEGVENLGNSCFANNENLTTLYLPSTTRDLSTGYDGSYNFVGNCPNLTDVYYNSTKANWRLIDQYENLGNSIYDQMVTIHCTDGDIVYNEPVGNMVLTFMDDSTIDIPVLKRVSDIFSYAGKYGFEEEVQNIKSVVLPSGVTIIGDSAFSACGTNLTSVTFPNTLQIIESSAFVNSGLTSIVLPEGLTEIYASAFGFSALNSADLPSTITSISAEVFFALTNGNFALTCRATIPPELGYDALNVGANQTATLTAIYVPANSVTDYQQDTNWSQYASLIQAIPQV